MSWFQASVNVLRRKKEREVRNPASGEDAIVPAKRVMAFKCSGKLRNKVNGKK
nr:HU family DNA-binding protein [uncultured Desulfosarcina sp.]